MTYIKVGGYRPFRPSHGHHHHHHHGHEEEQFYHSGGPGVPVPAAGLPVAPEAAPVPVAPAGIPSGARKNQQKP